MTDVRIGVTDGVLVITPPGAPTVLDGAAGIEVMVLEVTGGHLTWNLLAGERIPAAVLDDPDAAADWLWAVYGESVAVGAGDRHTGELAAEPAVPDLVSHAWRLAYAHWAARWWPASTIDGIAALDPALLGTEIATLTELCDLLVDGADAEIAWARSAPVVARQDDYALAAGGGAGGGGMTVARGVGGWAWGGCPPGLLDASERAVSWAVIREAGATTVEVRAAAAPRVETPVPTHLRPRAVLGVSASAAPVAEIDLSLVGDTWVGESPVAADSVASVDLLVPGVGGGAPDDPEIRRQVRALATERLERAAHGTDAAFDAPLLAEIEAAATDSDF